MYCEEGARQGWAVLQYSAQLCHNIITVATTQGAAGRWAGALGARRQARQACVGAGRGAEAGVRGLAGRRRQAAAARGRSGLVGVHGRRGAGELGVRGRRGAAALGMAWARGLALGSALSALGPF